MMRSEAEQIAGLTEVALRLAHGTPWGIFRNVGDVVHLRTLANKELVFASGGYDLWDGSNSILDTGLTLDEAVQAVNVEAMIRPEDRFIIGGRRYGA